MAPSTTQQAVEGIERYIRDHGLRRGDVLPSETTLCEELDCSRSSVREAMRTLQSLDIVEIRRGQGTFISTMSMSPLVRGMVLRVTLDTQNSASHLLEVVATREALESSLARELVEVHTPETLGELLSVVANMRSSFEDHGNFAKEDRQFHALLLEPTSNTLIRELSDALWQIHDQTVPTLNLDVSADYERTIEFHADMVRALDARDVEAFRHAVHQHYLPLRELVAKLENSDT
ncbi:FCD domain-containing protein [Corynebacterium felinum]|uniref:DNA-binding FadR family transcriptional regulator n=1 Tax=Corynebacterium felinum TaxID=131318 RepID=A0ABU2B903_9CORY|nr:FCD domain-containing protein [Corynebacterium felinum]MDF5821546.1 FCD domain-containing protein [Corynebacterium felinum]MDR7355097.1 DNA-binding FadR family transcriptional regulator [Corynebacterium felinum]WJY94447.1 HTH-type transcriptional regulator LutR [Corynebacterium felinum]